MNDKLLHALTFIFAIGFLYILVLVLTGCTILPETQQGEGASAHTTTLPATQVCILAACDSVFSDRGDEEAGSMTRSTRGAIVADQEATSTPTLTVPVAGGAPVTIPLPEADPAELLESIGRVKKEGRMPRMEDFSQDKEE